MDLVKRLRRTLNKPHPFIFNRYSVLVPAVVTFLVLVLLRPFEFSTFLIPQLLWWGLLFAVIVGVAVYGCVKAIQRYFQKTIEDQWTVQSEILLILLVLAVISVVVFVLFSCLIPQVDLFELFSLVVGRTLAISLFPVIVLVLYEQNYYQKMQRKRVESANKELLKRQDALADQEKQGAAPAKIELKAENGSVVLQVDPSDLLYIASDGNYVDAYYRQPHQLEKVVIRNSLKAMEGQLPDEAFFRCHKRFVVNLHHLQRVEGNARNLVLILDGVTEKIPVSRSKSDTLLQRFRQKA